MKMRITETLKISEISDGNTCSMELVASENDKDDEDKTAVMVLRQGPDSIWVDPPSAMVLGDFLIEWAKGQGE